MFGEVSISIIIPVYNERESLPELLKKISATIAQLGADTNCIISDDGSVDGSVQFLREAASRYDWLRVICSEVNQGKSVAIENAIKSTNSKMIFLMDGDLQNDADDFVPMLRFLQQEQLDAVAGWRKNRKDSFSKNALSSLYNGLLNVLFHMNLHDHNCGIKIINREVFERIPLQGEWHRYITVLMQHAGYKVGEFPVKHYARPHGTSRYGLNRYIRFFADLPPLILQARELRRKRLEKIRL